MCLNIRFIILGCEKRLKIYSVSQGPSLVCEFFFASILVRVYVSLSLLYKTTTLLVIMCLLTSNADVATVAETKLNFLKAYKRPIPSVYNTVLQELIVQQHLMRYKRTYRYDPVFALGFVTVYDQLMDGYPSDEDRDAIFKAYINALKEDPEQYRFSY